MGEDTDPSNQIGPDDAINFQRVVFIGLAIGSATSFMFHLGVKENSTERSSDTSKRVHKSVLQFLGDGKLYMVILEKSLYVTVHLKIFYFILGSNTLHVNKTVRQFGTSLHSTLSA